jgi:hypothetical protein
MSLNASIQKIAASWVAQTLRVAKYNDDFLQWVGNQRFLHPDTKNRVLFVSLPNKEQQKIYARWEQMTLGGDAERVREENKWLTTNNDPLRYDHVKFRIRLDEDEDQERLEQIFGTDDPDEISDRIMDLAGAGGVAPLVREVDTLVWNEGNRLMLKVIGRGDHGLRFDRNLIYDATGDEDQPYEPGAIENQLISVDKTAPPGVGTRMLASQVAAASEAGFPGIEAEAARSDKMNGYYTWPRLGFNAELTQGHLDELEDENPEAAWMVQQLAEADSDRMWPKAPIELVHVMAVPEARDWWEREGHTVMAYFPLSDLDGGKAYNILKEYTEAKAMSEGLTIPEYLSKMAKTKKTNIPPELTEQDNQILDQVWDHLRQAILASKKS